MKLRIRGEDYEADPNKLRFDEAEKVEAATGQTFSEWSENLRKGSMGAMRAFVWILMRRADPNLRYDDLAGMELGEIETVPDKKSDDHPIKPGRGGRSVDPTPKA